MAFVFRPSKDGARQHHDFQVRTSRKPFSMFETDPTESCCEISWEQNQMANGWKFLASLQWIWFPSFPSSPIVAWEIAGNHSSWSVTSYGPMDPRSTFFHQAWLQNIQGKHHVAIFGRPSNNIQTPAKTWKHCYTHITYLWRWCTTISASASKATQRIVQGASLGIAWKQHGPRMFRSL